MLDDILLQVHKPGRYIGREWNVAKKDFSRSELKFALCFPDLYEVGMSNLGLRIIYSILNNIEDVSCERFFSIGLDLENLLRKRNLQIFSLESMRPLQEFDIIGFSLGYELNYANVLNILELGGIPLKSSLRDKTYPLVIAGGPCALNPEPMCDFFDLFIIGEAEEALIELIDLYRNLKGKFKNSQIDKRDLLFAFSGIEGVYVPSFYDVEYFPDGKLKKFVSLIQGAPVTIKKRFIKDLDKVHIPLEWIVPFIQIVHDRITVEVMRGCPNHCLFCQARQQYFPFRKRTIENILFAAKKMVENTGYEEIALAGLSVSDFPGIQELLKSLIANFQEKYVAVSLPSMKPKNMLGNLSSLIAAIKKTGLTFAPEAATEKLRGILGKDFDISGFFTGVEQAFVTGYEHIKLYFMIGLPYESDKDLEAIVDFGVKVSELRRIVKKYPAEINISINTLIPKPHTPFQWLAMPDLATICYKQTFLKNRIMRNNKIKVSFHNRHMSFLEGIFSRGDRKLSEVVLCAFNNGARFDAWDEHFNFTKWLASFKECNINPEFYLQKKSKEDLLPWDFLDIAAPREYLISEFNKIIAIR